MTNTAHERRRATPPSDPSNGQLDRDGPVADVWDAASLRMSAENCRLRAESLNSLTSASEDHIWRPADGARGTLLNVAAILDSIASTRAAPAPPADSPGGDRMGVGEALKAAHHALTTTHNLRATDLTPVAFEAHLNNGLERDRLEFMIDHSAELAKIDDALAALSAPRS